MTATWIVERTAHPRFPYRIRIEREGRVLLAVRAQNKWPGAGSQIFCLREGAPDPAEVLEPVEVVPVERLARVGRKLSVILDRPMRKRCEFLKIERPTSDGRDVVEQIFFRTEVAARAHRTSGRVELFPGGALDVVIDRREQYPWRFPGSNVTRAQLPAGDYALRVGERLLAVVERKSMENLLNDVGQIRGLHQQLTELGGYAHAAMVVEAQYADFGNPDRVGKWPPSHLLRVLAELAAMHPKVPVVYAGNRKMGNVWAQRFFAAVEARSRAPRAPMLEPTTPLLDMKVSDGGLDTRIRVAALEELPAVFSLLALRERCPGAPDKRLSRILNALRAEGRLRREGAGRGSRWVRNEGAPTGTGGG